MPLCGLRFCPVRYRLRHWPSLARLPGRGRVPTAVDATFSYEGETDARVGVDRRAVEAVGQVDGRSEEHTSELQSLMRISYSVFCLKKNNNKPHETQHNISTSKYRNTNKK